MNKEKLTELLIYMITSAAGLPGEPKNYGPLRVIESARRLAAVLLEQDPENETLSSMVSLIEEGERKHMTDQDAFLQMLTDAASLAVDLI